MAQQLLTARSRPASYRSKRAVAAIDFGTTCTGYAYYLRRDERTNINDINIDLAWKGSSEAPTTVLMDPKRRFHSFGFEAEDEYKQLTLKNEHRDWFYFRHFKMELHHKEHLDRNMQMREMNGKTMNAMDVFKEAIKHVKDHLVERMNNSLNDDIQDKDIQWVITVPAIWRHSAKQFMREAASRAGIPNDLLTLALEPESAAIFCKEQAVNRAGGVDGVLLKAFNPGERYLVVDLGGGTVDTTGHEVVQEEDSSIRLKELHAATGGPWGGQIINQAFQDFLIEMVTLPVFNKFVKEHASDWIELQKTFEQRKRKFTVKTKDSDIANFPPAIEKIYEHETGKSLRDQLIEQPRYKGVQIVQSDLLISAERMEEFFNVAINEIVEHLRQLLHMKELSNVSSILLVGGFSESPFVSAKIRKSFPKPMRVIAPGSASVAIIKGAVLFGIDNNRIASRISPYTYGVHTRKRFNADIHPRSKKTMTSNGIAVVDKAFDKHIGIGDMMYVGETSRERKYMIANIQTREVYWIVYQSTDPDPIFCSDKGCKRLGKLKIKIPGAIQEKVSLALSMTCRGTELEAMAYILGTNIKCSTMFDFLQEECNLGGDALAESMKPMAIE